MAKSWYGRDVESVRQFLKTWGQGGANKNRWQRWFWLYIQTMVSCLAIQENALVEVELGYKVDIPVVKWLFTIFQKTDGWGMETIFLMAGIGCMFYIVQEYPLWRNRWLSILALFFGICMVFGRSYYDLGNWNYIFHGRLQFGLACFVAAGYYWLFKNLFILMRIAINKWNLAGNMPNGKIGRWLFVRHPFLGPLLVMAVCDIPFLISFAPGLLHADAQYEMWMYLGAATWTGHYPVAYTWLMGQLLHISRTLCGMDGLAVFIYTSTQCVVQWSVFAYANYIFGKLKVPVILRWFSLIYFAIYPFWQYWGFLVVKDSAYYIAFLLLVLLLVHILIEGRIQWFQWLLLAGSSVALAHTRTNGTYVLVVFCGLLVVIYRKYWKVCVPILLSLVVSCYMVENIYMVQKGIASGGVGEALSIPLQQTARYARDHYDDITEEEMEILTHICQMDMQTFGEVYNPEISDPVKAGFIAHPTMEELTSYFKVWFAQLMRHPDTYIQAFLNHVYGYFYPNREDFWEGIGHYGLFQGKQYWDDGVLNYKFMVKDRKARDLFEQGAHWVKRLPLIGMLYSCGFHNYILIACIVFLLANKRYRDMLILVPSILTVLVCLVSPVDAYIRYMLPVMAAMPVNIAWCYYAVAKAKAGEKEEIT